jgi:hypothetical protein
MLRITVHLILSIRFLFGNTVQGQRIESGGVFWQAIESVTPDEISAQAFCTAARIASSLLEADAVRHEVRP